MAGYGVVVGHEDKRIHVFHHDTGVFFRVVAQGNATFSPYFVSNFDPVTGLPLAFALGPSDCVNPSSVAATGNLFYLLDPYCCRVLCFDPATGSVYVTFGGRRGIGSGKISPDSLRRSVVAIGNGKVFVTDNDDGAGGSGNGFVVQYDSVGTFETEYSIASWIAALNPTAIFDQITGWAYDTGRGCYWALAGGAANVYLLRITTGGVPTGEVINLTTRLATTLGIAVPGHGSSPAERVRTRGLQYRHGRLFFTAGPYAIRVDLTNTDGDLLVTTEALDVCPGHISADGTEYSFSRTGLASGQHVIEVQTLGGTSRTYALAANPPTGVGGAVGGAWEMTVVPFAEDTGNGTPHTLQMRARITVTTTRSIQIRANIRGTTARTIQIRARITDQQQARLQMRARIEEAYSVADGTVRSWTVEDSLGTYSKGMTLRAASPTPFDINAPIALYAGYDETRVRIFRGEVDEVSRSLTVNTDLYDYACRDKGARELDSRLITKSWGIQFARTSSDIVSVSAHQVLREACQAVGVVFGGAEFPDYPLYATVTAYQESLLQLAQKLAEPWNLFPSRQYTVQIREGVLQVLGRDWKTPVSSGYRIERRHVEEISRKHTRYLQQPNLTIYTAFIVKGTTVTLNILDQIGSQTRTEYFRSLTDAGVKAGLNGAQQYVEVEISSTEETWGDKILSRVQEEYHTTFTVPGGITDSGLKSRVEETTFYFEPLGDQGLEAIQTASAQPSPLALPLQVFSVKAGFSVDDGLFIERERVQTEYFYDPENRLASESQSTTRYDSTQNRWKLEQVAHRMHSQTTAGGVRTHRGSFIVTDGIVSYDSSDAQQVGGSRPDLAAGAGRYATVTFQAIAPEPQVVIIDATHSKTVDPGGDRYVWTYENNLLGQHECEVIQQMAVNEKEVQTNDAFRWDTVEIRSVFNPSLYSGMAASIEVDENVFRDYWVESVRHEGTHESTMTTATARRLTGETNL